MSNRTRLVEYLLLGESFNNSLLSLRYNPGFILTDMANVYTYSSVQLGADWYTSSEIHLYMEMQYDKYTTI